MTKILISTKEYEDLQWDSEKCSEWVNAYMAIDDFLMHELKDNFPAHHKTMTMNTIEAIKLYAKLIAEK